MKLKRVTRGLSILALATLITVSCKKREPNVEPVADVETQSAIDAAWATYVISDIDQICAFMGENILYEHFYLPVAGSGTFTPIRDVTGKYLIAGWNKTKCIDGKERSGSIFMNYRPDATNNPKANPNSEYYRDYGFSGRVTLSEYKVDGWLVKLYDDAVPAYVYNLLPSAQYDPAKTPLSWKIAGKFRLIHPTDTSKNIIWDGELTKTLTNSSDKAVFLPTKQSAINWPLANVTYSGFVSGFTSRTIPYKMTISELTPLVRDFQCYPDKIAAVATTATTGVISQRLEEHHPFVSGLASFTTGTADDKIYPRQIYFGDTETLKYNRATMCDNTGQILIKGVTYPVNFRK